MTIVRFAERAAFRSTLAILARLDPDQASNLGAAVAGRLGPPLPVSEVADANLSLAFPWLGPDARKRIVRAVWESLGRTLAELPHLASLSRTASGPGWEVAGGEILQEQAARGGPAIFGAYRQLGNATPDPRASRASDVELLSSAAQRRDR